MPVTHCYRVFGLVLVSEFELPELRSCDAPHDISISYGQVPQDLVGADCTGDIFQATHDQFLLNIQNVARYLVLDHGSRIIVEPQPNASVRDVRLFLLDYALSAALRQRGCIVLHGSAISTPSGAVVFAGESGAGKSTLAAHMIGRGFGMLADDMAAILIDANRRPTVAPGQPYLKIFRDSLEHMGRVADGLEPVRGGGTKLMTQVAAEYSDVAVPLASICCLEVYSGPEIEMVRLHGHKSAEAIRRETRALGVWEALSQQRELLQLIAWIAETAKVFRIKRPSSPFLLDELGDRIVRDVI